MEETPRRAHVSRASEAEATDEDSALTLQEAALRTRIVAHCRAMYALDRTYANWAFDNYARMLPWLGLERK